MFGNYILVVVAIMIAFGLPAQADSGCYPAAGIEVFERTTVRERYWMKTINDRTATIGERFAVKASTMFEGFCWIQVADGWIRSKSVLPAMPPDPESTPAPKETGLDPRLPKSTMPQSELPRIDGDFWFTLHIRSGLDYLWREAREWFWYVVDNVESIGPAPESQHWSSADTLNKHVTIDEGVLRDGLQCASVMVHEACHMVQFDRGDILMSFDPDEKRIRRERECVRIQREAAWDIDPDSRYADFFLTWILSLSDDEYKAIMVID